jgi:UDP-N-acetylmuramyl pentapeptide phosphotransferase/UDP-N-acetylglucosamine-1-phosphate transferase
VAAEDRTLPIRTGSLVLGALLGAVGMAQDNDWLIYGAIGVLAIGGIFAIARRIKRE